VIGCSQNKPHATEKHLKYGCKIASVPNRIDRLHHSFAIQKWHVELFTVTVQLLQSCGTVSDIPNKTASIFCIQIRKQTGARCNIPTHE